MKSLCVCAALATLVSVLCPSRVIAQPRDADRQQPASGQTVRDVLGDDAAPFWIYEDVNAGIAKAKQTGKPLLVSIR